MTTTLATDTIHCQPFTALDNLTLYGIIRMRLAIFVEEQNCVYQDLDDLDLLPETCHYWIERDGKPVSYLRLLPHGTPTDPLEMKVSRVVTDQAYRGQGLSGQILRKIVAEANGGLVMDAQSYLVEWYKRFDFEPISGPEYLIDNIPHTAMRLQHNTSC